MKQKNGKRNIFILIIMGLLITLLGSLTLLKLTNEKKEDKPSNKDSAKAETEDLNEVGSIIINRINKIGLNLSNISTEDSFTNKSGEKCYKYTGENGQEMINSIVYTFSNTNDIFVTKEQNLYICIPTNCHFEEININDIEVEKTDEKDLAILRHNKNDIIREYSLIKEDGVWKAASPILECNLDL